MKLREHIYLVASGENGFTLTHPRDCNAYVIDTGAGLLMVDAGVGLDNAQIEAEFQRDGLRLSDVRMLILTHAHADHAAGAPHFLERTGAELVADAHEAALLADGDRLKELTEGYIRAGLYPEGYVFPPVRAGRIAADGDTLSLGNVRLKCLVCPGHTGGGLCLFGEIDGQRAMFTGDVVFFKGKVNLLSIFDADLLAYKRSVKRLAGYPVEALYPGHLQPVLQQGAAHIAMADRRFDDFIIPDTLL